MEESIDFVASSERMRGVEGVGVERESGGGRRRGRWLKKEIGEREGETERECERERDRER